jgi:6-phosphogluconolactonase
MAPLLSCPMAPLPLASPSTIQSDVRLQGQRRRSGWRRRHRLPGSRQWSLSVLDGSEPTQETVACWVVVTHDGRYAYATNMGSGTITGFSIAGNGDLTPLDDDGVTAGEAGRAPLDAAISYHNRLLYVLNSGTDQINGYAIEDDGSLTPLSNPVDVPDGSNGLAAR